MPTAPPSSVAATSGKARLLSGAGARSTQTQATQPTAGTTFTATVPFARPQAPPASPRSTAPNAVAGTGAALPRWAKGVAIGGVLVAVALPASVLLSRSMLVQAALVEQSNSKAAMVCIGGQARALDSSSLGGWLFGGSFFSCNDWETREARQQRERDLAHNNYMARQKARQSY